MAERAVYLIGQCDDPYRNIALEKHLTDTVPSGTMALYLWQNRHTVVLGRNQNPWAECRVAHIQQSGGRVARRLSGGGAVYHDMGNLNFTFLSEKALQDIPKQTGVILRALNALGIDALATGRNDLTTPEGFKFSGHAFYEHAGRAYHHGTLMADTNLDQMAECLSVPADKLAARGVRSVRSRVRNLCDIRAGLTVGALKDALLEAFAAEYGGSAAPLDTRGIDARAVDDLAARFASDDWVFGQTKPFSFEVRGRFPWGGVTLNAFVERGVLRDVAVYSDAMEADLIAALPACLEGCPLLRAPLAERLARVSGADAHPQLVSDVLSLLSERV